MIKGDKGVSCWDVSSWWREVEHTHHVHLRCGIYIPVKPMPSTALLLRLGASWVGVGGEERDCAGASCPWPWSQSKTLTGALFRLCVELDQKLSDRESERREGQPRLPFD
jgi:hypothetical protein